MTQRAVRTSWWDDLAAICAAPMKAAPRPWLLGVVAFALLLGRHDSTIATACQVGCGALVGGLLVRMRVIRGGAAVLWLVPGVAVVAHVTDISSRVGLGARYAVLAGALVALAGVVVPRRIPVPAGAILLWGGVLAVRTRELAGDALLPRTLHLLDLGWPIAAAAAALLLLGPTPQQRADVRPRRPSVGTSAWVLWGLAPALALVVSVPEPPRTYLYSFGQGSLPIQRVFALAGVALLVRVADHVARPVVDPALARRRMRDRIGVAPWMASALLVALAVAWSAVTLGAVGAMLARPVTHLGRAVVYHEQEAWIAYPATLIVGFCLLGNATLRDAPRRRLVAPLLAVVLVPAALQVARRIPLYLSGVPFESVTHWLGLTFTVVALVPIVAAALVPARVRSFGAVDTCLLAALVLLPLTSSTITGAAWALDRDVRASAGALETVVTAVLFHRLATCRIRTRTLLLGAVGAGIVSASVLIGLDVDWSRPLDPRPGHTPLPSLAYPNQLQLVAPIMTGWLAALVPLLFARGLHAAPTRAAD